MRTIAVANQKGGCGKTTTAINLAVALAHTGKRVLLVDLDPQACATLALSGEPDAARATVHSLFTNDPASISEVAIHTAVQGLDLAPSNISLAGAEIELVGESGRELRLAKAFRTVRDKYDVCIMDCPPSLGTVTLNALVASTDVIVPVHVDCYALDCAKRILETVAIIRRRFHRYCAGNLRILLTCVDDRTVLGRRVQQQMRELFGDLVLLTVIHRTVTLVEALAAGKAAITYAPESTAAIEHMMLAEELLAIDEEPREGTTLPEVAVTTREVMPEEKTRSTRRSTPPEPRVSERARKKPQAAKPPTSAASDRPAESEPVPVAAEPPVPPQPSEPVHKAPPPPEPPVPGAPARESTPLISSAQSYRRPPERIRRSWPRKVKTVLLVALLVILVAAIAVIVYTVMNKQPIAQAASVATQEDTLVTITLTGIDRDQDELTYSILNGPSHGILSGNPPRVTYTPTLNYYGPDSFSFIVNDGKLDSEPATVSILVAGVNDAPAANTQSLTVEDNRSLSVTLRGSDIDGDRLTFNITKQPERGTLAFDPQFATEGRVVYTPNPGLSSSDSFAFKVNDGKTDSAAAEISVNVVHVNVAPVATGGDLTTQEDTPTSISVTATDLEEDPLTYSIVKGPAHGSLGGDLPNVLYTPVPNYNGPDSFMFAANDGRLSSKPATVSILVAAVDDAPVADSQSVTVEDNNSVAVTLAGSDSDEDTLTFDIAEPPEHGTLAVGPQFASDGQLVYTPNPGFKGPDRFTFKVSDGRTDSASAVVSVNVIHVNIPPVANDSSLTTPEDTPLPITLTATDAEGGPLTYSVAASPVNGALAGVIPDLQYIPKVNFHGDDSFVYDVNDHQGGTDSATVSIRVVPVNDAPAVTSEPVVAASVGRLYVYAVKAIDPDEGDALTYSLLESPTGMSLDATTGHMEWTPSSAQFGNHQVTIRVADDSATPASTTQSFEIAVGMPAPGKATLGVVDGYDQKSQKALSADGGVEMVQAIDDDTRQTQAGFYTVYSFDKATIPAGARITSFVLYINHFEEPQFQSGRLEWRVGTGWPDSPDSWTSMNPSVYQGRANKGTLAWDLTVCVDTPEKVNAVQFHVKNNCTAPQKTTFVDYVYAVVRWQ